MIGHSWSMHASPTKLNIFLFSLGYFGHNTSLKCYIFGLFNKYWTHLHNVLNSIYICKRFGGCRNSDWSTSIQTKTTPSIYWFDLPSHYIKPRTICSSDFVQQIIFKWRLQLAHTPGNWHYLLLLICKTRQSKSSGGCLVHACISGKLLYLRDTTDWKTLK